MRCDLESIAVAVSSGGVLIDADVALVAELNGLPADVLIGVPGVRGYAGEGLEAALVTITVGSDANVSFVATRPDARRRGLATAVTAIAIGDARDRGRQRPASKRPPGRAALRPARFHSGGALQEWLPPT